MQEASKHVDMKDYNKAWTEYQWISSLSDNVWSRLFKKETWIKVNS